ncbi:TolB family protein [Glaciecola sp. MF2-115]|uniref:TolB family protein n=1 Tax=Glaciecola sp. MF2-115 TaxID=3384827 RepID=UPI0039A2031F
MKSVSTAIILLLFVLVMSNISYGQDDVPIPSGPYLGQTPPGSTPELFAPGIVNTEELIEIEGMFGADMHTFYFVRRDEKEVYSLNVIEFKNNQWQKSIVKSNVGGAYISSDGKIIYLNNSYIERTNDGWSELKRHGSPFEDIDIMRLSAASNGTYYFDTFAPPKFDTPIRYSRLINGKYEQPKSLGPQFGIGRYNAHPFIAPDESYIIFDSIRDGGYGKSDLYISFRGADGSWGPAINMGDKINTAASEKSPSVSPDGKFLFFDLRTKRGNEEVNIYWVDAQIIDTLRPK